MVTIPVIFFRELSVHGVPRRCEGGRSEGRKPAEEDMVAVGTQRLHLGVVAMLREMVLKAEPGLEGDKDVKVKRKAPTAFLRLAKLVLIYLFL